MRGALWLALVLWLGACGGASTPAASTAADEDVMFDDERRDANVRHGASATVLEGERALTSGDLDEARRLFAQAVAEDASDARARLDFGVVLELQGDLEGAETEYRAALAIDPAFAEVHNNLGLLLRDRGQLDEAITHLERAIALRPGYAAAQLNLGLALEQAGRGDEAITAYRGAVRAAPDEPIARTNLGLLLLASGAGEEARIELRRALPLAAGQPALLEAIGSGLRRAGDASLARQALEDAVEASAEPGSSLRSELALAQYAAGAHDVAEATLRALIADEPRYATAHYLLGTMLLTRGDAREGKASLRRFLALEPDSPLRPRAEAQLAR